jgi:hypothetical protein
MSLTWAPGAYTLKNQAHNRVMKMEASMKILPKQQILFNKANQRENNRRALRIRMERLANEIAKEKTAIVVTTQKVMKATAVRTHKARERELRRKRRQQMQLRPTTSAAGSLCSTARTDLSIPTSRLNISHKTSLHLARPETSASNSSTSSSKERRRQRRRQRQRQSQKKIEKSLEQDQLISSSRSSRNSDKSTSRNPQSSRSRPQTSAASSTVSDRWLAEGSDNQAPFSARRHHLTSIGMDYVPMDFAGHADLLRSTDGPARVAKYFGKRRKKLELRLKLAQKSKIPAFGRKQTDISRVPEKQAACSSLKYMDGPASGDVVRTHVPVSDVTAFVNFHLNGAPFLRPLGEQHHLKLTNLVKERQVLHENLGAMGDSAISKNDGLFGTWM